MLSSSLLLFTFALTSGAAKVVDLGYARYQGIADAPTNITSFLAVRYAAPPTGFLRWRAPEAPGNVTGVQLADTNPPACLQGARGTSLVNPLQSRAEGGEPSEDCLFLNVFTPDIKPKELLPTIVWIHGGAYAIGSAQDYNGLDLAAELDGAAVVVVLQYRLGLFGFLAGNEVKNDGALNAGLLDQQFALRWVNRNIGRFGGDASRVTLWGQSAGAGSIMQHMIANGGKTSPKLYSAGILSSPFLPQQYPYNHWVPQAIFDGVASQAGCGNHTTLDCLRAVDAATLETINLNTILQGFQGTSTFVPVVDGKLIQQSPTDAFLEKKTNGGSLLAMTNVEEGFVFVNQEQDYNVEEYVQQLFPTVGKKESTLIAATYAGLGSPVQQATKIMTDSIFICPAFTVLEGFRGNSFKGEYGILPSFHGDDLRYYFPRFTAFPNSPVFNNTEFIEAFRQAFFSFALHRDPNTQVHRTITPTWPLWDKDAKEMVLNRTDAGNADVRVEAVDSELLQRCELWKSLRGKTFQ
ncbi:Carboxylic ester hydrolase [Mycena kentingensis (nom. inval.)]|nr:Carboxylic ester hydrolase [Mycena kentingensis (nom. inval.)]